MAENMLRGRITDEAVELMRRRIGYSNPTIRSGVRQRPHWTEASRDALRHWTRGYGDDNPLGRSDRPAGIRADDRRVPAGPAIAT